MNPYIFKVLRNSETSQDQARTYNNGDTQLMGCPDGKMITLVNKDLPPTESMEATCTDGDWIFDGKNLKEPELECSKVCTREGILRSSNSQPKSATNPNKENYIDQEKVTLVCPEGQKTRPEISTTLVCRDGNWIFYDPNDEANAIAFPSDYTEYCQRTCAKLVSAETDNAPRATGSGRDGTDYRSGEEIVYECPDNFNFGHSLERSRVLKCDDSAWRSTDASDEKEYNSDHLVCQSSIAHYVLW